MLLIIHIPVVVYYFMYIIHRGMYKYKYIGSGLTCSVYTHARTHTHKGYFNRVVAEFMVIKPVKRALRFSNILLAHTCTVIRTYTYYTYCHSSL